MKRKRCFECGAIRGTAHESDCSRARCRRCGRNQVSCRCKADEEGTPTGHLRDFKPSATPTNVRLVSSEAFPPESLYASRPLEWFCGRAVKTAFQAADARVEHMWVQITHIEDEKLVGTLDNEPIWVEQMQLGDTVKLRRTQIEAVDLSYEEWVEEITSRRAKGDFFNRWLGSPLIGDGLELLFSAGFTPRQALERWRDYVPTSE